MELHIPKVVGVDTGGTFTDFVQVGKDGITAFKLSSTPRNPAEAVKSGIARLYYSIGILDEIIHGSTVATNALLERKGARVLLLTTHGFEDVVIIGRQNRQDIYELVPSRPIPLTTLREGVHERVLHDGSVEISLTTTELQRIQQLVGDLQPDAVAIALLFAFLNPVHEQQLKKALASMNIPLSLSSEVLPEYREYERISTTIADAYVKPLMDSYISQLSDSLRESAHMLTIMKSNKGLAVPQRIVKKPVDTILSGLAGGIIAAEYTSQITGIKNIISLDIGGTSTDVAQILNGVGKINYSYKLDGLPIHIPAVAVETIGAGGGSISRMSGGLLRVGPESAGANPGPASYGLGGTHATTTDADLLFGILPHSLAGDSLQLNVALASRAVTTLAQQLQLDQAATVRGIRRIFHENIAAALRKVTIETGQDPRSFALLAFGGAGSVHACELADLLKITSVIVPPYPGVWSAFGLLNADYMYEVSQGIVRSTNLLSTATVQQVFVDLIAHCYSQAQEDGVDTTTATTITSANVRFVGQSFELEVLWDGNLTTLHSLFTQQHRQKYGFAPEDEPIELVTVRVKLIIPHESPKLPRIQYNPEYTPYSTRSIQNIDVPVYNREDFTPSTPESGPLLIDQTDTTIYIPATWQVVVDEYGFLFISKEDIL